MAIGYTVVMGWILKYTIGTFTGAVLAPADIDGFAGAFGSMASSFGNNFWQTAALVICMIILMFGVGSGIEKANKIMMPVFFVLFIILGIYVAFQPGASMDTIIFSESIQRHCPIQSHGFLLLARHSSLCL